MVWEGVITEEEAIEGVVQVGAGQEEEVEADEDSKGGHDVKEYTQVTDVTPTDSVQTQLGCKEGCCQCTRTM